MIFDNAEGMVFRPPSEANSLIIRITIGCSHNECTFCGMYRETRFRTRPMEEIEKLIRRAASFYPDTRRVFLADGNALVLTNEKLLTVISMLRGHFPRLSRITCYGGPKDILRKTPEELSALRQAGLQIIYLGIESGDDEVLALVKKGVTAAEMTEAGQRVVAAGIKLSTMVILGLGGEERTVQHAVNTARVVSAVNPTMLSALTLMIPKGTPLRAEAESGRFRPLSPYGFILELKMILENIEVTQPCIFRSNHVSNLLPLAGTLPADKDRLVREAAEVAEAVRHRNRPTFNDSGPF